MTKQTKRLTERLNIQYPIIQAPMAGGITTPQLVAAVSQAGGLGSFGAAYMRPDELRQAIREVRSQTAKPFQVNLFVPDAVDYQPDKHQIALAKLGEIYQSYGLNFSNASSSPRDDFAEQVKVLIEEKVPVVSFTFGIPDADILADLRKAGSLLVGTATCVAESKALADAKFDAIVAQGFEAGGHRATFHSTLRQSGEIPNIGLFALIPQLVAATAIPIIASGGIMDGKGIVAALALGAEAAQLGTAFMGCPEANLTASWRDALNQAADTSTELTKVFSGRFARGIHNNFIDEMDAVKNNVPPFPVQNSLTGQLRAASKSKDDPAYQSLWAGQAANLTRRLPAGEFVRVLVNEIAGAISSIPRPH